MQEDELAQILSNMGEYSQPLSLLDLHIEEEPKEHSTHDKNPSEELCDEEEEEENHFVHDESISGEKSDEDTEEEQSVPSQTTPEEFHGGEGVEKEVTKEITEQARIFTPKQPDQNNEGAPQEENKGISQDNSPGSSKQTVVLSKKIEEIKRLRKE